MAGSPRIQKNLAQMEFPVGLELSSRAILGLHAEQVSEATKGVMDVVAGE